MSDDPSSAAALAATWDPNLIRIVERPLQLPGRPTLLRRTEVGGPDSLADRRLLLSREALRRCLAAAEASPLGRAQLDRVSLVVELYRDASGHQFEVWTINGLGPRPEELPPLVGG